MSIRPETIEQRVYANFQTLCGWRICELRSRRLRAVVERNAYDEQSFAKVENWTERHGWVLITTLPIGELPIFQNNYGEARRPDSSWNAHMNLSLTRLIELGVSVLPPE